MRRKNLTLIIFVVLGLTWGLISQWPDGRLHLIQCDVGQGDAILLTQGFSQVLIDGGPNNQVASCLANNLPFWDHTLELVIATHPDKDHIAGLTNVIERYHVKLFVSINVANNTTYFKNLQAAVWDNQVPVYIPQKNDQFLVGKIKLKVLSPEKSEQKRLVWQKNFQEGNDEQILGTTASFSDSSTNDQSVVIKASFGEFDALFTGDITASVEQQLVSRFDLNGIEVLKVSHHGSKYSTSEEFLRAVGPQLATIGVGKNQWGQPAAEVLDRLAQFQIPVLRTDLDGEIEIVSDGQNWYIRK